MTKMPNLVGLDRWKVLGNLEDRRPERVRHRRRPQLQSQSNKFEGKLAMRTACMVW